MIKKNSDIYHSMIDEIASLTHEKYREIYRDVNNGTRIKTTKDKEWIKKHKTDQSDLAKLNYYELPSDWKFERYSGAKTALDAILDAVKSNQIMNNEFVEHAASIVHSEWLSRNLNRAEDQHKLSYVELSEEAKEKDRIFVVSAIEVFNSK